jgi:PhnB protein
MPIQQITPYLHFGGDADAAIKHYEATLGAKVGDIMHFGDVPEHSFGPEAKDLIMHTTMQLGAATLMLSDVPPGFALTRGDNVQVTVEFDDVDEMTRSFTGLAEGGEVNMALHDAFWGAKFGMLTDKFGVRWLFTCPLTQSAQGH